MFLLRAIANVAGTERVMSDKINWLAEQGHDIVLVTYEQGDHPISIPLHPTVKFEDLNVRFFKLSVVPLFLKIWRYRQMKYLFKTRLQHLVDSVCPDVLVLTTYSINLIDIIADLKTNARIIMESHTACYSVGKEFDYSSNPLMKLLGRIYDKCNYRHLKSLNKMIVLTKGDKADWSHYVDNVKVIPNPLTYYPMNVPEKKNMHRILCVGRLNEQKGFDLLIDAFAIIASKCPEWRVDIYGHGEDKEQLLAQIKENNLEDRINIRVPVSNIYEEYQKSDFFVLSSRYEGFGLVLVEAMSCETPCVSFNCKYGPDEIIDDGVDGLLVRSGDVCELSNKMLWMITHENERLEMGRKARLSASRFRKERVMLEWEQAYLS